MNIREQLNKHLSDLPCPLCKRPVYFRVETTLVRHLSRFHRRVDISALIHRAKVMCGMEEMAESITDAYASIGSPITPEQATDLAETLTAAANRKVEER